MDKLAIVFDGPPGPDPGRFVEVELNGKGVSFGDWQENGEFWELVLPEPYAKVAALEAELAKETHRADQYAKQRNEHRADLAQSRADNARMRGIKIVCLCGSSRFVDIMAVISWLLEKDEGKISMGLHLLPRWYPNVPEHHLAESEGVAEQMDELHLRKIDLADEAYVIDFDGYIGESTSKEIIYATEQDKPIRYLSKEPQHLNFVRAALEANDDAH